MEYTQQHLLMYSNVVSVLEMENQFGNSFSECTLNVHSDQTHCELKAHKMVV